MEFTITGKEGSLKMEFLERECQNATDFYGINWLKTTATVRLHAFSADFTTIVMTAEIKQLYDQIKNMQQTMSGEIFLRTLEAGIKFAAKINKQGIIEWNVQIRQPMMHGATLTFILTADQSYLTELLRDLKNVLNFFPVIEM